MTITPASLQCANLGPLRGIVQWAITLPEELHSQSLYPTEKTDAGLNKHDCTTETHGCNTGPKNVKNTFHSVFHDSFTLLVRYRSLANKKQKKTKTTQKEQHSLSTRLVEGALQ